MNWLEKANAAGVEGFLHPAELEKLVELARGKRVLEIGAYRGLSAWGMAHSAVWVQSVDTFRACTNGQRQEEELQTLDAYLAAVGGFDNVGWYVGTSESAAARGFGDFNMIFLDAMHDYDSVKADIARWWPRVRPGGVMAFHDYRHLDFPGVQLAVDEVFGPAPEGTTEVTLRWVRKESNGEAERDSGGTESRPNSVSVGRRDDGH